MSTITVKLRSGDSFELTDNYIISQLEAYDTIDTQYQGSELVIPFHSIDVVAVGRSITPVTHEDANCEGVPVSTQKWYYTEDWQECFELHDGDSVHFEGCNITVFCEDGSAFEYSASNEDMFFETGHTPYQICDVTTDNYISIYATKNNAQSAITVTSNDSQITFDLTLDTECGD